MSDDVSQIWLRSIEVRNTKIDKINFNFVTISKLFLFLSMAFNEMFHSKEDERKNSFLLHQITEGYNKYLKYLWLNEKEGIFSYSTDKSSDTKYNKRDILLSYLIGEKL